LWPKYISLSLRGIDSRSSSSQQVTLLSDQRDPHIYKHTHTRVYKVTRATSETKILDVEQEKNILSNSIEIMYKVKQLNRHVILLVNL
jgi:hypothetical protein